MSTTTGSIALVGVIDGTTVIARVMVDNGPLVQFFGENGVTPDYEQMFAEAGGSALGTQMDNIDAAKTAGVPKMYIRAVDTAADSADISGTVSNLSMKYNDTAVTFDAASGMDSNHLFLLGYDTIGGANGVPCVWFVGNLASGSSNSDDDLISFSGQVQPSSEGQVNFTDVTVNFQIRQEQGEGYVAVIGTPQNGSEDITTVDGHADREVLVFKNNEKLSQLEEGTTLQWDDVTDPDNIKNLDSNIQDGKGFKITIAQEAVNSLMMLRVQLKKGTTVLATAYGQVLDLQDPPYVVWKDGDGNLHTQETTLYLRRGGIYTLTPLLYSRDTGTEMAVSGSKTWAFGFYDNRNDPVTTGDALPTVNSGKVTVSYANVKAATGRGLRITGTCTYNV